MGYKDGVANIQVQVLGEVGPDSGDAKLAHGARREHGRTLPVARLGAVGGGVDAHEGHEVVIGHPEEGAAPLERSLHHIPGVAHRPTRLR